MTTLRRALTNAAIIFLASAALGSGLLGCRLSRQDRAIDKARAAASAGNFSEALKNYREAMDQGKDRASTEEAAREAAKIADFHLKDFDMAIALYKNIILSSTQNADRTFAQKRLAEIYFGPRSDYVQAIVELHRLLEMSLKHEDEVSARSTVARSYYYREDYFQAHVEVDQLLAMKLSDKERFEALLLKATIFSTAKQFEPAIKILAELMTKYPQLAKDQAVGLVLAMTYEGMQDMQKAIETLQGMRAYYPNTAYLDSRIQALRERQNLMPGAKGLKK